MSEPSADVPAGTEVPEHDLVARRRVIRAWATHTLAILPTGVETIIAVGALQVTAERTEDGALAFMVKAAPSAHAWASPATHTSLQDASDAAALLLGVVEMASQIEANLTEEI